MKRDFSTLVIGVLFLAAGILIGGVFLGLFELNINLAGWWTIFIIAPALFSIAQGGLNAGNLIMLAVGAILLLNAQQVLPVAVSWKLIFPIALIAVGIQLLFGRGPSYEDRKPGGSSGKTTGTDRKTHTYTAFFSGQDIVYDHEVFTGASYNATFGGLTADLRNVTLNGDAVITVSALFGGIDIILPNNVKLVSHVLPILGGMESKYQSSQDSSAYTIIVRGSATFGGVTVK